MYITLILFIVFGIAVVMLVWGMGVLDEKRQHRHELEMKEKEIELQRFKIVEKELDK